MTYYLTINEATAHPEHAALPNHGLAQRAQP